MPTTALQQQTTTSNGQAWIHIHQTGSSGIAGPFTGNDIFTLAQAGVHMYPSQSAAQAAPAQVLNQAQATAIEKVALSGPGIGQGFFGLTGDIGQAVSNADVFKGLDLRHLLLQISEVVLGIALIGIGIAHLTGNENVISNIVKKVPL